MEEEYIDLTEIENPDLVRAGKIMSEIGEISQITGSNDIEIDRDTLLFLKEMLPRIEALLNTIH